MSETIIDTALRTRAIVEIEPKESPLKLKRIISAASVLGVASLGLVLASPAHAVVLTCGDILSTPNTTVVLTADVDCTTSSAQFGVAIAADNITLDLNGHTVRGDGKQPNDGTSNWGVYVTSLLGSADNAVVKDGEITAFNTGVYLEQVNGATLQILDVHHNVGPDASGIFGEGIQTFEGGTHTITQNKINDNGPFAGLDIFGPTNNNIVTVNQVANNNIFASPTATTMQDIGIWLINLNPAQTTTNNTIDTNSVTGNGLDGIQVATFTNGNTVDTNNVTGNGFGQTRRPDRRDGDGIAIFGSSNVVDTNQVLSNGGNGIGIELQANPNPLNGKNNTISGNFAFSNGSAPNTTAFDLFDGNLVPPCDNNSWTGNTFGTRNQTCIN